MLETDLHEAKRKVSASMEDAPALQAAADLMDESEGGGRTPLPFRPAVDRPNAGALRPPGTPRAHKKTENCPRRPGGQWMAQRPCSMPRSLAAAPLVLLPLRIIFSFHLL